MRRSVTLLLVGLLVVVDAVLVVVVIRHVGEPPPPSDIQVSATADPESSEGASAQQAFTFDAAQASTLSVASDGTVVTARRGRCEGGDEGTLQVARPDARLEDRDPGLRQVLAVRAETGDRLVAVGTDDGCQVVQRSSTDAGQTWTDDPEVTLWYPSTEDVRAVVTPRGSTTLRACQVISLSQVDDDFGRVACSDGKLFGSGDQGRTWRSLGRLDNVRVVTYATFTEGYALARFNGCAANAFSTEDSGRTWKPGGCITGDPARAISSSDAGLVAVVGTPPELFTSDDDGAGWEQR